MKFPLERYKFFVNGKKEVVAMSTYAGRYVKGIAKCSPEDEFDVEFGKRLAAARCNLKVAQKREANARKGYDEAYSKFIEASLRLDYMINFVNDASKELNEAYAEVRELEESI